MAKSMRINYRYLWDTKTCYRFQHGEGADMSTIYLKKADIETAGIDPKKGIVITVEEDSTHA